MLTLDYREKHPRSALPYMVHKRRTLFTQNPFILRLLERAKITLMYLSLVKYDSLLIVKLLPVC